jgi:hypothetical protein
MHFSIVTYGRITAINPLKHRQQMSDYIYLYHLGSFVHTALIPLTTENT